MHSQLITRIEAATLTGRRPRAAGNNARLGSHGLEVSLPLLRLTTADGAAGFGICLAGRDEAERLLGADVAQLWQPERGVAPPGPRF